MLRMNKTKPLLISILIFQLVFAAACDKSKVRQLAKAEDDVAQGLLSVATVIRDAKANGTLSQDDVDLLKPLLLEIGNANKQAIAIGKSLNNLEDIPLDKQAQLLQIISFASDTITTLNNQGVLRIKDPQKRLLFNALALSMQTAISSIVIILKLGEKQ